MTTTAHGETTDPATAAPADIDHRIATLYAHQNAMVATSDRALAKVRHIGRTAEAEGREQTLAELDEVDRLLAVSDAANRSRTEASYAQGPLFAEFTRRGGWTRYHLVEGGHLHANAAGWGCSRTPRTVHHWVTDYSGLTSAEAIDLAGERVCTVCFPAAPVKPGPASGRLLTPSEAYTAAHREQADRARAARKATQITTPDGDPLYTANGDLVKTAVAANRRAMEHAYDLALYGTHPQESGWRATIDAMVAALAHAQGVTEAEIRAGVNAKIAKRMKREQGEVLATI